MHLDTPYKILDLKPDQELLDFDFSKITHDDWKKSQELQRAFNAFSEMDTFRIMFLEPPKWTDCRNHDPKPDNVDHPIYSLVINQVKKLEEYYNGKVKTVVLDGLPPGAKILRHNDPSAIFDICSRIHLPLVTHPDVKFFIDDIPYYFKAGEFFEFNNKLFHEVQNNSDVYRIHLLVDLLPN